MRGRRGFTVIEILITIAISSLVIMSLSGFFVFIVNWHSNSQHVSALLSVKSEILAALSDETALGHMIDKNDSFECVQKSEDCALVEKRVRVYNHNGRPVLSAADPKSDKIGINFLGRPCMTFDPVDGDLNCAFQVRVFWSPVCSGPCVPTQIRWRIEIQKSPKELTPGETANNYSHYEFELLSNLRSYVYTIGIDSGLESTCAWLSNGRVKCWGRNDDGQLARGFYTPLPSGIPTADYALNSSGAPLEGVVQLVDASDTICAVLTTGRMVCWGEDFEGQLGRSTFGGTTALADYVLNTAGTAPFEGVNEAVSGENFVCLRSGADYYCWGSSNNFEHPNPTTIPAAISGNLTSLPSRIQSGPSGALPGVWTKFFSRGRSVKCVLVAGGELSCWGQEIEGGLGNGVNMVGVAPGYDDFPAHPNRRIPAVGVMTRFANDPGMPGQNLTGVVDLSIGKLTLCALLASTEVVCWGRNESGQAGQGIATVTPSFPGYVLSPSGIGRLNGVQEVSVGNRHVCVRTTAGEIYCWGKNAAGQLGNGSTVDSLFPTKVVGLPDQATSIRLGMNHSCALLVTGKVYCWGENDNGEVGIGVLSSGVAVPSEVQGL